MRWLRSWCSKELCNSERSCFRRRWVSCPQSPAGRRILTMPAGSLRQRKAATSSMPCSSPPRPLPTRTTPVARNSFCRSSPLSYGFRCCSSDGVPCTQMNLQQRGPWRISRAPETRGRQYGSIRSTATAPQRLPCAPLRQVQHGSGTQRPPRGARPSQLRQPH